MRPALLSPTDCSAISVSYLAGEHTGALAARYGVSSTTIRRALTGQGIVPDRRRSGRASWAARLDELPDEGDLLTGYRWCRDCKQRKPMDDYYWHSNKTKTARQRRCKPCHGKYLRSGANLPANRRKHRYGLTSEEFERMFQEQDGRCRICRAPIAEDERTVNVDHCHFDLRVRGLLCPRCNTGIGYFLDDPDLLTAAANYLIDTGHYHPPMETAS